MANDRVVTTAIRVGQLWQETAKSWSRLRLDQVSPLWRGVGLAVAIVLIGSLWILACMLVLPRGGGWFTVAGAVVLPAAAAAWIAHRHLRGLHRTQQRVVAVRDQYRGLFENADEVLFQCDPSGRFLLINPAGIELLGVDPVSRRLALSDVVTPDHVPTVAAIAEPWADRQFRIKVIGRGGAPQPLELTTRLVRDNEGSVTGVRCLARPIREVRTAEVTDSGGEIDHFRTLIESLAEGVVLMGTNDRVLLTNPPGESFLADYGTFLAERRLVLFAGIPIEVLVARTEPSRRQEIMVREPDEQVLEVYGQQLVSENGRASGLLVIRDVTEERQRSERLRRSDQLAAVGQLAAGISHDFKNILQGINLCAELARSGTMAQDEHQDNMLTIVEQCRRGSKLIQQIMDFTRQSETTQRLLDTSELVNQTRELLSPGIPENVELSVELPDDELPVMADAAQLQQVVANLVLNARDAMPDGGRITIRVTQIGSPGDRGPVPGDAERGDWLRIAVEDTGTGIPESASAHVFEPFFTTKQPRGGTGLGLAQVLGNVQQQGGMVDFESTVGVGTTFHVILPLYLYHQRSDSKTEDELTLPTGSGETVLIVEDELAVLSATSRSLASLGYRPLEAVDGNDALRMFEDEKEVRVLLTDIRLPGIDGLTLAAEIKGRSPDTKLLLMSAHGTAQQAGASAADGFLSKPFSIKQLASMMHEVLTDTAQDSENGASS